MDSRRVLDHFEKVLETGPEKWRARCPSHQGRKRSLSLKYVEGKMLLHCFAGCEPYEVLESVGLSLCDLYDPPTEHCSGPVARQHRIQKNARETLEAIQVPITIIVLGINAALDGTLGEDDLEDVSHAYETVTRAMAAADIDVNPALNAYKERQIEQGAG